MELDLDLDNLLDAENFATNNINILHTPHIVWPKKIELASE